MIVIRRLSSAPGRRRVKDNGASWVLWTALVMIVGQLALRAWGVSRGWFVVDDFVWYSTIHNDGVTSDLVFGSYLSHLQPGAWLLTWMNWELSGLDFTLPMIELVTLSAIANLGALVFLVSSFGRRPGILPPLAVFLFSAITVPASYWWAAGVNQLPTIAVFMWGSWAHINYLRTRRYRWLFATTLITMLGLFFAEKTLLVFLIYAIIALSYFASGDIVNRFKALFSTYRLGVLVHGVLAFSYLGYYLSVALQFDPTESNNSPLGPILWNMVARAFSTGILGGPLQWSFYENGGGIANPGDLLTAIALVVLGVLIYEIAKSRSHSKRAWFVVAGVLGSDLILVASSRATWVGPVIGLEYRYITETAAAAAISLALATMSIKGAVVEVQQTRPSSFLSFPPRVAIATAAVSTLAIYSTVSFTDNWQATQANRNYYANAAASLNEAGDPVPVADTRVPSWLIWDLIFPDSLISRQFPLISDNAYFPDITTDSLYIPDATGALFPVALTQVRQLLPPDELTDCPYPVVNSAVDLPMDGPALGLGWWIRVEYSADSPTPALIEAGDNSYATDLKVGLHGIFFKAEGALFDTVSISGVDPDATVCVSSLTLGLAQPFGGQAY